MSDGILGVLQFAIDGVSTQQDAIANNLANADTKGFIETDPSFQDSLQSALQSPNGATAKLTEVPSASPVNADGNNVDTATDLVSAEKATLQYQTISESINAQFRLISGSAGGSYQ